MLVHVQRSDCIIGLVDRVSHSRLSLSLLGVLVVIWTLETGFSVFETRPNNFVLFLLENIPQILLQLLYLLLLLCDFVLQEQVLILHLRIRAHLAVPLLHRIHNIGLVMPHAGLGHAIVGW